MKKRDKIIVVIIISVVVMINGFVIFGLTPSKPMAKARDALESSGDMMITKTDYYEFVNTSTTPTTGLIIYPGGRVDPRSYAPTARNISADGYYVAITLMALNFAIFSPNKADQIISENPGIANWVICGHSLGGVAAALYVKGNSEKIDGLVFWASYPSVDLSESSIDVSSIYASNDGLTTVVDIENSKSKLPASTTYVEITGGNHAQFGYYGGQFGDGEATITREMQQTQIISATIDVLDNF